MTQSSKPQAETLATLGILPKGATGETIRIAVKSFNGSKPYLDIRQYVEGEGEPIATRKGVTMPVESIAALEAVLTSYLATKAPNGL